MIGVIVNETDRGETGQGKQRDPHVGVSQVGPQQGGHDDGDDDQQSTHRRSAGFGLMRLGSFFPNDLSNGHRTQFGNEPGAHSYAHEQSGDSSESGAERDEPKDTQGTDEREELLVKQIVKHQRSTSIKAWPPSAFPARVPGEFRANL
jgi:hypothetical protein